jgi:hypothetical protein
VGAPLTSLKQLLAPSGRRVAHARFLTEHDPRWRCHDVVEIVSAGADEDFLGVGSSPYTGDYAGTALTVPATATNQAARYIFRLAAIQIPGGASIVVRGLRFAIELIAPIPPDSDVVGAAAFPLYLEQSSPFWHFSDANVSWHVRHHTNIFRQVSDTTAAPGTSPTFRGTQPARIFHPGGLLVAPGRLTPPGVDVEGLGTIRELRYAWTNTDWSLAVPVSGPGIVALYCSVKQTDPTTRPQTPFITPNTSLRPEDRFILETRQGATEIARYGRVAGAMLVEMFPSCGGGRDDGPRAVAGRGRVARAGRRPAGCSGSPRS